MFRLETENIERLIVCLKARGYTVIGPTVQDGAILHQQIASASDLPVGVSDEQQPGSYTLKSRNDKAMFGYAVGPQSFKKFLFPPFLRLFSVAKNDGSLQVTPTDQQESTSRTKYAFFGIRPCELHAILVQDKVLLGEAFQDYYYKAVRENILMVAVNCGQPASTYFCASLHTGPRAELGYDLCLTEILKGGEHYFVLEVGTDRGGELLSELPHRQASEDEVQEIDHVIDNAAQSVKRDLDASGLKEVLYTNTEHQRWEEIAKRCLACANCTLVCPTCFCSTVDDVTDLSGTNAERHRTWDSCFMLDFSYIHGGSLRTSVKSRYRQWMTHKLASWVDQFGTSGCVGCGRCITWCPVGIDITEEARLLRDRQYVQQSS